MISRYCVMLKKSLLCSKILLIAHVFVQCLYNFISHIEYFICL